eukprot:scaffold9153_cov121-Cylindrotheca_fusiformis.AAC.13
MGTYLSTPVTDKCEESGESLECPDVPCSWGVVDMQGWRKSMEDAHIAVTDIPLPSKGNQNSDQPRSDAKVFGVFDGHGGAEVARFCSLYLVSVLTQQQTWKAGFDVTPPPDDSIPGESAVGLALRNCFHALDRMIDDPERREELVYLRNNKPLPGERRDAISIPKEDADDNRKMAANDKDSENNEASSVDTETENQGSACLEDKSRAEKSDDDSDERVGEEEASKLDRNLTDGDSANDDDVKSSETDETQSARVTAMFQKILALGTPSGETALKLGSEQAVSSGPSASKPTIIQNGRKICNLPDHPIHAGATAIVSVLTGRILTVANAGDSRAVLCRAGGRTEALSFDHKPMQERETTRITKAGGFVNQFGRVNGNLNLSRSIGDLKYKQVPGIPPAEQMITSEPDIVQVVLDPEDEFIVLGCDGIWDCLSNENAVEYVRERIDTKSPTEIGVEMLDDIISEDPRVTQGIGGDNMTIMIIDLRPNTRTGKSAANSETPEAT